MKSSYLAIAPLLALCTGFAFNADSGATGQPPTPVVQGSGEPGAAFMNGTCFGCEAYTVPGTSPITVTGTLCGHAVGLRLTFNNIINGECLQTFTCGPTKTACFFSWKLEYASRCLSFVSGKECGVLIPVPTTPNPIATWTPYLASSTSVNCGGTCDLIYHITCQNCTDPSVDLAVTLACEPCIRF